MKQQLQYLVGPEFILSQVSFTYNSKSATVQIARRLNSLQRQNYS